MTIENFKFKPTAQFKKITDRAVSIVKRSTTLRNDTQTLLENVAFECSPSGSGNLMALTILLEGMFKRDRKLSVAGNQIKDYMVELLPIDLIVSGGVVAITRKDFETKVQPLDWDEVALKMKATFYWESGKLSDPAPFDVVEFLTKAITTSTKKGASNEKMWDVCSKLLTNPDSTDPLVVVMNSVDSAVNGKDVDANKVVSGIIKHLGIDKDTLLALLTAE